MQSLYMVPYIIDNVTKIFSTLLVLYCTFMLATLFTFLQNLASFFCVFSFFSHCLKVNSCNSNTVGNLTEVKM